MQSVEYWKRYTWADLPPEPPYRGRTDVTEYECEPSVQFRWFLVTKFVKFASFRPAVSMCTSTHMYVGSGSSSPDDVTELSEQGCSQQSLWQNIYMTLKAVCDCSTNSAHKLHRGAASQKPTQKFCDGKTMKFTVYPIERTLMIVMSATCSFFKTSKYVRAL